MLLRPIFPLQPNPPTLPDTSSGGRGTLALLGASLFLAAFPASAKTLVDYFLPTPIIKSMTSNPWGNSTVQPRDQDNGIEDKTNKSYSYWDGRILQAKDGKYHLYVSRWNQSAGHNGWFGSSCVHTVSDSILGPYVDKGLCYSDASGQGHNVMVGQLNDGTYFILVSETRRPATIYTSSSLDGPWNKLGTMTFDKNGTSVDVATGSELHSNTTLWVRPDNSILCTGRHGIMSISTNGLLGPYKVQGTSVFPNVAGRENTGSFAEDPVIWFSGNLYHMIYNYPDDRYAYHLTSTDGVHNWTNKGIAFDPRLDFIRYTNGTINHWWKMERPQVFLRDGHVTHFTMAVMDAEKATDVGNDNHNSKVIVIPFDGLQFDKDNGWVPPAGVVENKASILSGRLAISLQGEGYVLDYSGFGTGEAWFEVLDLSGRSLATKRTELSENGGTVAWTQLNALPKGVYLTKIKVADKTLTGNRFVKF